MGKNTRSQDLSHLSVGRETESGGDCNDKLQTSLRLPEARRRTTRSHSSPPVHADELGTFLTEPFEAALALAAQLHREQKRKGTIPYISHLLALAAIALEHGATEDEAISALLHDTMEDAG